jgi:hypothetical protein
MKRISLQLFYLLCLLAMTSQLSAQGRALSLNYGVGYLVANHPRFPQVKALAHSFELAWESRPGSKRYWSILNKYPSLALSASVQTLGNGKQLGQALAFAPIMGFELLRPAPFSMQLQMGWGLAYLTKRYDSFSNPENIVVGTHLNAYATARLHLAYRIASWEPFLNIGVAHYSNGNVMSPNLGFNIPMLQAGLRYRLQKETRDSSEAAAKMAKLPPFRRHWSPFVQAGLGISATVSRGPFFPVQVLSAGGQWRYARSRSASAGLEYSFNASVYAWALENGGYSALRKDYERYAFWLSHEWIFGHFGFSALGGIYLNKHEGQRSVIPTQVGLNFYPRLPYRHFRHQVWVGLHIRAYFGLAEFVMLQAGYRF